MKLSKKITSILIAATLTATSLVGCAEFDVTEVAMTVNGDSVSAGVANFYCRYQQSISEAYYSYFYGDDMWNQEVDDGVTYQDYIKEETILSLSELLVIEQHAEELGVSLTDEEMAAIEAAATSFVEENEEDVLTSISGTYEYVVRFLELFAIDEKCTPEIVKDVDTEVSDEDAAQKRVAYTVMYFTTTDDDGNTVDLTDDELVELYEDAEALLAAAQESGDLLTTGEEMGYSVYDVTFDSDSGTLLDALLEEVDVLTDGEFAPIVSTDSGYYIAQLISEFDEDATEAEKESIIAEREATLYQETLDTWVAEAEIVVFDKVWDLIDFDAFTISIVYDVEETTDEETEEVTEEEVTEE